jgi:ADP-heptose:LPS heptosyltransferase
MTTSLPCSVASTDRLEPPVSRALADTPAEPGGPAGVRAAPDRAHTLAIHPGALGDVLLAVPALRVLRASRPGEALVLAAQPPIATLLRALGEVDDGVDVEALGLDALFVDAPATGRGIASAVVDARHVVSWLGAREATFVRRLTALVPGALVASSREGAEPVWEHLVRTLGVTGPAPRHAVHVSPELLADGRRALEGAGWDGTTRLMLAHPGTASPAKRWPAEGYAALIGTVTRQYRLAVAVHEGPRDAEAVADLMRHLDVPAMVLHAPPLATLAGALRQATLYVGNDSGVSQLAAATGVPSVLAFTPAMRRWRPWHPAARCVEIEARAA